MNSTEVPRLVDYDICLVNSSAGKDSQAMLTHIVELADQQQYPRERIVVVHADLGRVEWEGTRDLAQAHDATYGLQFEVVRRDKGDLLAQIEARGMFRPRRPGTARRTRRPPRSPS
jgi:3'-phosphoadenosine 5'-phosphosulfate sulfotransferase (PAPS reductase)/FAD synthetase